MSRLPGRCPTITALSRGAERAHPITAEHAYPGGLGPEVRLRPVGARRLPALLDLPWSTPLEEWPAQHLVALPQGISRHIVRFVRLGDYVYAVKETGERVAEREYDLLRALERINFPSVEAVAIVADRQTDDGRPLDPVLITRHLQFSLPYRALFSRTMRPETMNRLLDALAVLLVRMHLTGFFWGDCSLSNTLFRRDAGAFAAYLVDAETGALHRALSNGQRGEDLEIARVNIFGEALDLAAAGLLHESIDPEVVCEEVVQRYERLWHEITYEQQVEREARHDIEGRIRRLNELGFDVAEVVLTATGEGTRLRVRLGQPTPGRTAASSSARPGTPVDENQARRLLNDIASFRGYLEQKNRRPESLTVAAHRWLAEVYDPATAAIPDGLRAACRHPRSSTRSSSTAGTCPRRPAATSAPPPPPSPTSLPSCPPSRSRSLPRRPARPTRPWFSLRQAFLTKR